jgi:hypothetical protein
MTEDDVRVLSANEVFYEAFSDRDPERMDGLWAREREVTCIHPGWSLLVGRERVMASWRAILRTNDVQIEPSGARAFVAGESAYVVCFEAARGQRPFLIATNVFVREDGEWRLVHHHAGQLARPGDPLEEEEVEAGTN